MNELNERPLFTGQEDGVTEIDLVELFAWYLTKWPVILIGLLAGAVIAGGITFFMITPKYTADRKSVV